ncbi:C3a anaphylatoxin chemotactic receptor-like [Megalobrama amblycephala]|uniref:C3a anaphylatoxin chemotactic receptor-like n=1 Tax=Megalobrama amblycephala TaxID=75352 RepID=UPI0020143F9E|nr:C3a anaphylatoxin chemotactic receptor-like [Megalobrama amblycephala]
MVLGPSVLTRRLPNGASPQTGSPVASGRLDNTSPPRTVEAMGLASEGARFIDAGLPTEVVETILNSRAPATRKLYSYKWNLFSAWCRQNNMDPVHSPISFVLRFLQEKFSEGLSPSTLKVYVAAISAFHAPLEGGFSVGRDPLVTRFLRGTLRLRLAWDLAVVLQGIFHHCIICVFGVAGNGLVIYITGLKMKSTVNTIWFLNLVVAGFLFSFFLIFNVIHEYHEFNWPFGDLMCFLSSLVTMLNMFAIIFLLTAIIISLDRCLCTWMVVWAQNNRTVLRARIICVIVWVSSISCSIPSSVNVFPAKFLVTYIFLVGFLIPFLIIASSHIAVGVRIKRLKMGKQHRSYRVIIAIILTFFVCCFPYHVCSFCKIKMENWSASDEEVFLTAIKFSIYLVFLNSCLNPILYVFMCDEYKKKLKQSLLLVLETAFSEEHLIFKGRQIQKDEQNKKNTFELLDK